jgi:hypothetical protein
MNMEAMEARLQAVLAGKEGQRLMRQAFKAMLAPPKPAEWQAEGARGWHLGACLVLAEGLRIWLQDEAAELWGVGEWTEAQERPPWDTNPNRYYHHGYWDVVEHVLLASGDWLIDAAGIYPKADPERLVQWWQDEFGPCVHGARPLAGLKVSMDDEGIRSSPRVSEALAALLEHELGSGVAWLDALRPSEPALM